MSFDRARIDEVEVVPQPGRAGWKPLRRELGITAFGLNVWTGDSGSEVIGPHVEIDEQAGGHEEVYIVLSGNATFIIGDEAIAAGVGDVVAVHDPAVRRGARADADGTSILAIGSRIGLPFEVGAWEFLAQAGALAEAGDLAGAVRELERGIERRPESATIHYHLACYETLSGVLEPALDHLVRALALRPELRELAVRDPDLEALRVLPAFQRI